MSRTRVGLVGIIAAGLMLMSAGAARADNLQVADLTVVGDFTVNVDEVANISYHLTANSGDGGTQVADCNAADLTPASVTINVPAGVTVSPNPLTLTKCKVGGVTNGQVASFSSGVAGDYQITATVTDAGSPNPASYNEQPATFTLHVVGPAVVEDETPPVLPNLDDITQEATSAAGAVVSYGPEYALDAEDGSIPVVFSPVSGGTFPLGDTIVTYSATDDSHNTASDTFTVHVVDTTPPALSNPQSDVSVYGWNGFFQPIDNGGVVNRAKAGQSIPVKFNLDGPATVNFTPPTAIDLVDGPVDVTCDYASGSVFPQGVTTVTCSATDAHDNTATNSFDVTVQGGNLGTSIMWQGYPNFAIGDVPPANTVDGLEEYAVSTPGLHYDAVAKQYVYVWATSKAWAGKSGTLRVKLSDGSMHTALFNFQK
jgi:hypothetical protein